MRLLLQDSRIDVNKGDRHGWTGLMYACCYGHGDIVSLLLQASRTDVNKGNIDGKTGFLYACENRYLITKARSIVSFNARA